MQAINQITYPNCISKMVRAIISARRALRKASRDSRDAEHRRTTSHTFSHLLNLDDLQILDTLPFSISLTRHFVGRIAGRTLCARTHKKRPTLLILSVWRFTRRPAAGWKSSADRNLFKAFKNKSKVCSFLKLNFNGGFAN